MTRWAIFGATLGALLAVFVWWRGGVLTTLPASSLAPSTSTPAFPLFTAEREVLLKFEDENLAEKLRQIGTSTPSRKSAAPTPPPKEEPPAKDMGEAKSENVSKAAAKPAATPSPAPAVASTSPVGQAAATSASVATSTVANTAPASAATSAPIMVPPSAATSVPVRHRTGEHQFLVDGKGFCPYDTNSVVLLSGYPLVFDAMIEGEDIKSWTDDRVVFWVPDSIPPGAYRVTVRGMDRRWGYCIASTSSPQTITVK